MTPSVRFDDRARTLTHSLLADATRVPSRLRRERVKPAQWRAIAVFAATVLVISGAVVGASVALRSGPAVAPIPASPAGHWKSFQLPGSGSSLAAVSCPDTNYCVAVDYTGDWYLSTDPDGGAQAWKIASVTSITKVPSGNVTTDVSCVGRSLCVAVGVGGAVDQGGWVLISTDLGGRPTEWMAILVDRHVALSGISCPSVTLCVAVGRSSPDLNQAGVVITAKSSLENGWGPTDRIAGASGLTAISCPTVKFCVATDGVGHVITSSNPSGGIGAWQVTRVFGVNSFTAINCPTVHFCAAVDGNGQVVTSTDPTGGSDAWAVTTLDVSVMFDSVSCPSAGFCVAGGLSDSVFISSDPTAGSGAWTRTRVIPRGTEAMTGLSCPSKRFCAGVDGGDGVHVFANPAT